MPIPTAMDHRISKISDLAAGVVVSLQILRRNPSYDRCVRERFQDFADAVVRCANEILAEAPSAGT